MAKDPAFLFYPGDWQGGTMHMTHLEKGCYMDLLMLQFNRGKFTEAQAKHMLQSSFDLAWPTIQEKFVCEDGLYWNERLTLEKEKRARFTESRRNNASKEKEVKTSEKHMLKDMHKHTDKRMENENEDRDIEENKKEKPKVKKVEIPTESEFLNYYQSELAKNFPGLEFQVKAKYEAWVFANWKDGNGNKILNWKIKLKNTISFLKNSNQPIGQIPTNQKISFQK